MSRMSRRQTTRSEEGRVVTPSCCLPGSPGLVLFPSLTHAAATRRGRAPRATLLRVHVPRSREAEESEPPAALRFPSLAGTRPGRDPASAGAAHAARRTARRARKHALRVRAWGPCGAHVRRGVRRHGTVARSGNGADGTLAVKRHIGVRSGWMSPPIILQARVTLFEKTCPWSVSKPCLYLSKYNRRN